MAELHPSIQEKLQYFAYDHLPPDLAKVSKEFADLAHMIVGAFDLKGPQVALALQKLIEAKDCAVRAAVSARKGASDGTDSNRS